MDKIQLINFLLDEQTTHKQRILALDKARSDPDISTDEIIEYSSKPVGVKRATIKEEGFFGNVWVRSQYFPTTDIIHDGHKHIHDHISLLQQGSLKVIIEGEAEKTFHAPTFITIAANKEHQLIPLEPKTLTWCIFALRKSDGTLCDYYNSDNSPYGHAS